MNDVDVPLADGNPLVAIVCGVFTASFGGVMVRVPGTGRGEKGMGGKGGGGCHRLRIES